MDTINFISSLRQQALLLGDYNAYRRMCSRRLAKLRKKLGRVHDPKKKDQKPAPVTVEDIARDPAYVMSCHGDQFQSNFPPFSRANLWEIG